MVMIYKGSTPSEGNTTAKPVISPYPSKQDIDTRIPPKAKPVMDEIRINGVVITESDILAEAQNHPAKNAVEAVTQAARALVVRELLWQEANRLGLTDSPEKNTACQITQTPVDVAINRLIEQEVNAPQATEENCRHLYAHAPERFLSGTIIEARHILIAADPKNSQAREQAKEMAVALINELQANINCFAALAQKYSACPSAAQGGNLGQLSKGSTVPEFEKALKHGPEQGLMTTPVETRYGYHIVYISRKIAGSPLPFEAVRERIAAWLEASSWSRAVSQYITLLASQADIEGINILSADGPLVQ